MKQALDKEYKIIRIFQEDILYNKINWEKLLEEAILDNNKNIIYISKDNSLYEKYKLQFNTSCERMSQFK
jgi:hypothetical protein